MNIVSVSGGKDSTCLYLWAIEKFGKDGFSPVFADTGHEHPVTYNYVRNLPAMADGPEIHWVKADLTKKIQERNLKRAEENKPLIVQTGNPFLDMMLYKGRAPSSKAQFCTEILKLKPIKDWLESFRADLEINMYVGIRAGESPRRSVMPAQEFSDYYDCEIYRPILTWSEPEVFQYLKDKGVPPNPLYAAGFSRVGCFPCIHSRKSELALLPEWAWDKLQEWEDKLGRSWFSAGTVPGVFIPTINDAREWAKTSHGGRQYDLMKEDVKDVPSCMSTWGACE